MVATLIATIPSSVHPGTSVVVADVDGWRVMHFLPDTDIEAEIAALTPATDHQTIMRWDSTATPPGPSPEHLRGTIMLRILFGIVYQTMFLQYPPSEGTACVVGLGGGALVHLLHGVFKGTMRVRAVELDQAVATAAVQYFSLPIDREDIHVGDAAEFFALSPEPSTVFARVVLDLFGERPTREISNLEGPYCRTVVPPILREESFYRSLREHMLPSVGVLIVNFVITEPAVAKAWLDAMRAVFGKENMTLWFASQFQGVVMCVRREAGEPPRPSIGTPSDFAATCETFEKEVVKETLDLAKWI